MSAIPFPDLLEIVGRETGVVFQCLASREPAGANVHMARQIAMWTGHARGYSYLRIADQLGRAPSAVKSAVAHVEILRRSSKAMEATCRRIIEAIEALEVDETRAAIFEYRKRGAKLESIARFVGITPQEVASVLGVEWRGAP